METLETTRQTVKADIPSLCPSRRAELESRVSLYRIGLAALSTRELSLASALQIEVDFTPSTAGAV